MAKIFFCFFLLSICFSTYVLGKPVKPWVSKNERNGCACETYTCKCCADLVIPQISLNDSICIGFGYEPNTIGISLILAVNDKALINETISASTPPPICFAVPYAKKLVSGCIRFSGLSLSKEKFHGCAQLELRMGWVHVVSEYNLGCFDTKILNKQHAKILKLMSKYKILNSETSNVTQSTVWL